MFDGSYDPDDDRAIDQLDRPTLEEALDLMRHQSFFHTHDLAQHNLVRSSHRADGFHPDFQDRGEAWLIHHAARLGLRGPLPGHPTLGARWGFYDEDADPSR